MDNDQTHDAPADDEQIIPAEELNLVPSRGSACPCCGNLTLSADPAEADWDICLVCFWENDPDQRGDETLAAGANPVSLAEARRNYQAFGAADKSLKDHVRAPLPHEIPNETSGA
ncbi:CPCC family cysteine-rich protein [Roseibium aestuarii]|uniref:CPCC family cysteine-rich protein n=1 Tax=Roseibium aestuarii TaxID=2600299 RepID=A0ABW4K206_9HYPH|nr:CPCC family cysteine-rich protein [Roseibium aestuarii]